uniref:Uncharacterized protein n=1 Tax=viral metagenome TaxID=1070528 RepID=A0A6M3J4R9_9ZZZZ
MKVNDLLDDISDILQEDFTYAPLWTKLELLGYLRQTVKEFCQLTLIADDNQIRLVDAASGELDVPSNFHSGYYLLFNQYMKDIVEIGDLDFISSSWSIGTTGTTPRAATLFGSGAQTRIRLVPVPTSATGAFQDDVITSLYLEDSASVTWAVTITNGTLVTTAGAGTASTPVLKGPSTLWDLSISTTGVLITTASSSTTHDTVYLSDTVTNVTYSIECTDLGILDPDNILYGLIIKADVSGTTQTFNVGANSSNVEYGIVVDMYATGVSTTPSVVGRVNRPIGVGNYARTSDNSAMIWYKSVIQDIENLESELFLSDGLLPIIKHGILAKAYGTDNDGRDDDKAKLMREIFITECNYIKTLFQRR